MWLQADSRPSISKETSNYFIMTNVHLINRRSFDLLCASALSMSALGRSWAQDPVDVPWSVNDPYLSGNFLPVMREMAAEDLPLVSGRIPKELRGVYMRNGPNPQFKPNQYTYPLDGDGMIHALRFEGGTASYRNRFLKTAGLELERRAGRAVYGSVVHPLPIDPGLFLPGDSRSPIKNGACINVIRHGDHILALGEANAAYEIDERLETLGPWKAGGRQPVKMGAHNHVHPRTGDLYALEYSVQSPTVKFHRFNPSGLMQDTRALDLPAPMMIHDFVLTQNNIVLLAGPAVFDFEAARRTGGAPLQWRPEMGMTIAVLPLAGGNPRWLKGDPFFVYHFANGFEREKAIVIDYVHHENFTLDGGDRTSFRRLTIHPDRTGYRVDLISSEPTEFPTINRAREATPTRYVYTPVRTASLLGKHAPGAIFNCLVKTDMETGRVAKYDAGDQILGEAVFIPRPGCHHEDDGYLGSFAYDPARHLSSFILLNAQRIEEGPECVIRMPQRVPQGLHGNWMARLA